MCSSSWPQLLRVSCHLAPSEYKQHCKISFSGTSSEQVALPRKLCPGLCCIPVSFSYLNPTLLNTNSKTKYFCIKRWWLCYQKPGIDTEQALADSRKWMFVETTECWRYESVITDCHLVQRHSKKLTCLGIPGRDRSSSLRRKSLFTAGVPDWSLTVGVSEGT